MPIYEYKCLKCGHQFELIRFELIRSLTGGEEKITCPLCGDHNPQKILSAFSCAGSKKSDSPSTTSCSSRASRFT